MIPETAGIADRAQWESSRAAEPMDFPAILFGVLAKLLDTQLGTRERHRRLQDLESILYAHIAIDASQGGKYRDEVRAAAHLRDAVRAGKHRGVDPREAVDVHQKLWLEALMGVIKRQNLAGETWRRG